MSAGGKGHDPRPMDVPRDQYEKNRALVFPEPVRVRWVPPPLPDVGKPQEAPLSMTASDVLALQAAPLEITDERKDELKGMVAKLWQALADKMQQGYPAPADGPNDDKPIGR